MNRKLMLQIAGIGWVAGMRAASAPALVNTYLSRFFVRFLLPQPARAFSSPRLTKFLWLSALGELIGDKLPFTPNRTDPPSLIGRTLSGALSGVALSAARHERREVGVVLGGLSAVVSSFVMMNLRKTIADNSRLPDPAVALMEDGIILAAAYNVQRQPVYRRDRD